jgi:hypothetical protein
MNQASGQFNMNFAGAGSLKDARILYLADDRGAHKQLLLIDSDGKNSIHSRRCPFVSPGKR